MPGSRFIKGMLVASMYCSLRVPFLMIFGAARPALKYRMTTMNSSKTAMNPSTITLPSVKLNVVELVTNADNTEYSKRTARNGMLQATAIRSPASPCDIARKLRKLKAVIPDCIANTTTKIIMAARERVLPVSWSLAFELNWSEPPIIASIRPTVVGMKRSRNTRGRRPRPLVMPLCL